ncbi:AMIN domain-containing protein, partial [Candidatus Poribacteria bacterium]|nr:AMIN domain-containing protein [Candidatus Poribacteria bacterium]
MSSLQFMKYKKIKEPGSKKELLYEVPRKLLPLILQIAITFILLHAIICAFCYGLVVSDIDSETSFNTLSLLKASFAEKDSALVVEIKGTQPIDYSTMFLDANQEKQYRFCVDINNARNKIDIKNLKVNNNQQSSDPISLTNLIEQSSFPLSNLVVAQNSLTPLITRMVFHLREKIEPTVQVDNQTMQVKIPLAYIKDNGRQTTATSPALYEPKTGIAKEPESESNSSNPEILKDRAPERPAIIESIKPIYLPKTTKLEISSDRPLRIKEVKMSKGGVLKIEIFNAKTSLPNAVNLDKGIIRNIAFETQAYDLRIYMNLKESVLYDIESSQKGLIVTLQNPLLEQLVSINVNNEPISSVLLMLFTQYGANIVAGSDVKGNVTARLLDVPLKAALNEILKAEEYGYVEENGLIRVISKAKMEEMQAKEIAAEKNKKPIVSIQSRLYQLKYAKVNDIQQTIQKIAGA